MAGTTLELFPYDELARDVGPGWNVPRSKFPGITLAHNVRTRPEVDDVLAQLQQAGGEIVKPAAETSWGGYSACFGDPDGYLWEVAWGALEFNDDGSLRVTKYRSAQAASLTCIRLRNGPVMARYPRATNRPSIPQPANNQPGPKA